MTEFQKIKVTELYAQGYGYKSISVALGISRNTVKSFIQRHGAERVEKLTTTCLYCGNPISQGKSPNLKKFCSDKCRSRWWCENRDFLNRKAIYTHTCTWCGAVFTNPRKEAKYCNRTCYMSAHRISGSRTEKDSNR